MKKVLHCIVTRKDGATFTNPLKLSEAHLISQLAKENRKVEVFFEEIGKEQYKELFGL